MDISVIIPTLNRCEHLLQTLLSLATIADGECDVEVIVVDNGSSDKTVEVFQSIAERYPRLMLRYFRDDMPGLLTGRHRGAKEARGDILAYLDDDVLLAPGWLEGLRDALCDPLVVLVGGPSRPRYEGDPPAWLDALWWESEDGRTLDSLSLIDLGSEKKSTSPCLIWGLNFSIRKNVFQECGGFHPDIMPKALQRYQGDGETGLSLKVKKMGNYTTIYHPDVAVTHMIPAFRLTLEAFERRGFFQGVCDSYTRIRSEVGTPPPANGSWKDPLRSLKRKAHRTSLLRQRDAKSVRELIRQAHSRGFAFHREQIRYDPALLSWIRRPDYFDYSLPAGWEAELSKSASSNVNRASERFRKRIFK